VTIVTENEPQAVTLDGEVCMQTPVEARVADEQLRLLAPEATWTSRLRLIVLGVSMDLSLAKLLRLLVSLSRVACNFNAKEGRSRLMSRLMIGPTCDPYVRNPSSSVMAS
jgi:hypothetical protein